VTSAASGDQLLQLRRECIRHIFENGRFVAAAVMGVAVLVSVAMWPLAHHQRIVTWALAVCAIQLSYLAASLVFRRWPPREDQVARWGWGKFIHALALGLAWGLGAIALHRPEVPETAVYLALAIAGPTAASTSSNAFHPPSLFGFVSAAILPFVAYLLGMDDRLSHYFAAGLLFHLLFLTATGLGQVRAIREAILLRFEKESLVGHLRQETEHLERVRAMVETSGREKSRFFAAANHDLRQPLHALGFYVSLLRKDPQADERRSLVTQVSACVESLGRLLEAMIDVYRGDTAGERARPFAFPVQDLLDQALVQAAPEAAAKGLRLRCVPSRLWGLSDRPMLERVLGNLVGNAIRYTETGSVLVGVRHRGQHCTLVVADTGVGISDADRLRIFDEFFQAANPARDRERGYGLGLATVRRHCQALGHALEVRSTLGRGSSFAVTLPLAQPGVVAPLVAQTGPLGQHPPMGVLLLEDDRLVRDAMWRLIDEWGLPCCICEDGDAVIAALNDKPHFHWHVVLDHRLPGPENGLQIAARIQSRFKPAPPMTLVTGETDPQLPAEAAALGVHFLRKPLKPLRLRAVLLAKALPQGKD
jgi:signal transduction histidine kinase/CheY-like chemotaxis protein